MQLVILAAGMGSRFGGLKQMEPMDDYGNFILDYSIHDAIKAGFDSVIFIIKKEHLEIFRETIGKRVEPLIKTEYAFQDLNDLPEGFVCPDGRTKPWGTAHAILAARHLIRDHFIIKKEHLEIFRAGTVIHLVSVRRLAQCAAINAIFASQHLICRAAEDSITFQLIGNCRKRRCVGGQIVIHIHAMPFRGLRNIRSSLTNHPCVTKENE